MTQQLFVAWLFLPSQTNPYPWMIKGGDAETSKENGDPFVTCKMIYILHEWIFESLCQGVYYFKYRGKSSATPTISNPQMVFLNPLPNLFEKPQTHRHIAQTLEGSWLCFAQHKSVGGLYWSLYKSKAPDELVLKPSCWCFFGSAGDVVKWPWGSKTKAEQQRSDHHWCNYH